MWVDDALCWIAARMLQLGKSRARSDLGTFTERGKDNGNRANDSVRTLNE